MSVNNLSCQVKVATWLWCKHNLELQVGFTPSYACLHWRMIHQNNICSLHAAYWTITIIMLRLQQLSADHTVVLKITQLLEGTNQKRMTEALHSSVTDSTELHVKLDHMGANAVLGHGQDHCTHCEQMSGADGADVPAA